MSNSRSAILDVLHNRNFRNLWSAQIISQTATSTLVFVLALRLYQITGSNTAVSGIFFVYAVPALLFGMVAGTIVDKLENRTVLVFCDLARAFVAFGYIIFPLNVPVIYLFTFLSSVVTQFYVPSEAPAIPYLVNRREIITANSLFSFTYYSSLAVGSIFAGPLLKAFGHYGVFAVITVFFLIAAFQASKIPRLHKDRSARVLLSRSFWYLLIRFVANIREGINYVRESKHLLDALVLLVSTQVVLALLGTLGPGFADRVLEIDVRDASLMITGPAVLGIVIGALWVGSYGYRFSQKSLINLGVVMGGLILVVTSVIVRLSRVAAVSTLLPPLLVLTVIIMLFFLLGFANSLLDVPANTILQAQAKGEVRGRVYGILTAAVGGLGIIPVVIGGILADTIGVGKVILIVGVCIVAYGMIRVQYTKHR